MASTKGTGGGAPVVALVCLGLSMTTFDSSIVSIGLPPIAHAVNIPLAGAVEWIVICYLVTFGGLLLSFGRLSDIIGRSPVWLAGLVVFTIGSAVSGAASSLGILIAARSLQGIGGALIFSTSAALLTDAVPETQRGHALGWGVVATALGASAGPTVGGLLTAYASWRWIFYVNLPFGLVAVLASLRLLPPTIQHGREKLDPWGALLLAVALAALTLGLSFGQEWGWTSSRTLGILVLGVTALIAGIFAERRLADPIIDLHLFTNRTFVSAVVSLLCAMLALFAVGFLFAFYGEQLRGFTANHTGLLLTPFPVAMAIVSPSAGALSDRVGSHWLAPLGLAITAVALLLMTQLDTTSPTPAIAWRLALAGAGLGLFLAPNTSALMSAAPDSEKGMASGVFATARITGESLSIAVAGAVFTGLGGAGARGALAVMPVGDARRPALEAVFLHGFHAALATCAVFAAVGAFAALLRSGPGHPV